MDKAPRLSAEQRDDLVAYLDDELDTAQASQIDKVLSRSEVARHEVEALARTWEMLDVLPRVAAPSNFTQTTMTTLRTLEVQVPIVDRPWFKTLRLLGIGAVWVGCLSLAAWAGFFITTRLVPNAHDELLRDSAMIERLDLYQEVQDAEFLRQLQRGGVFEDQEGAAP